MHLGDGTGTQTDGQGGEQDDSTIIVFGEQHTTLFTAVIV
jgi:hypothetical protein